jgi:hypothetical protein
LQASRELKDEHHERGYHAVLKRNQNARRSSRGGQQA